MNAQEQEAIQEAHDALLVGCSLRFCDGPDSPPQDMITCAPCRAAYTLRQTFPFITFEPEDPS